MTYLDREQIAALRGCNPATVSRHKLPKVEGRYYDPADPEVRDFILEPWVKEALRRELAKEPRSLDEMGDGALEVELTRENIELKRRQSRKMDLEHEIKKKNVIPRGLMIIWISAFANGIRNFLLPVAERVARDDTALRNKIEKEQKVAIEKIIASANAALKSEGQDIKEALGK